MTKVPWFIMKHTYSSGTVQWQMQRPRYRVGWGEEAWRSHAISGTLPCQYQHVFSNPKALPTPPFRLSGEAGLTKSLVTSQPRPPPPTPRRGAGLKAPTLTLRHLSGYHPPSLSQLGAHSHLISIQKTLSRGRSHKVYRYPATKTKYFLTMPHRVYTQEK